MLNREEEEEANNNNLDREYSRKRNSSLPRHKREHATAEQPREELREQNDIELKKMILQLGKDKARLEQRCEDRKKNLKKLYFIAREKDKQLRKACNAIEHAGLLSKGMED